MLESPALVLFHVGEQSRWLEQQPYRENRCLSSEDAFEAEYEARTFLSYREPKTQGLNYSQRYFSKNKDTYIHFLNSASLSHLCNGALIHRVSADLFVYVEQSIKITGSAIKQLIWHLRVLTQH